MNSLSLSLPLNVLYLVVCRIFFSISSNCGSGQYAFFHEKNSNNASGLFEDKKEKLLKVQLTHFERLLRTFNETKRVLFSHKSVDICISEKFSEIFFNVPNAYFSIVYKLNIVIKIICAHLLLYILPFLISNFQITSTAISLLIS